MFSHKSHPKLVDSLFLLLLLPLSAPYLCTAKLLNDSTSFSSLSYNQIHEYAIRDQVENYSPPHKSLHTRKTVSLNGLWDFCVDSLDDGFSQHWYTGELRKNCKESNFYRMPVPSSFNDITSNSDVKNYIGWFWYQRTIVPSDLTRDLLDDSGHLLVQFESVNYMAVIWIQPLDGSQSKRAYLLGSHVGGHLPFALNLTDIVNSNKSHNYRLTVAISNRLTQDTIPSGSMKNMSGIVDFEYEKFQPDFDFFHFAGILGNVNLIRFPRFYIKHVLPTWLTYGNLYRYRDGFDLTISTDKDDPLVILEICPNIISQGSFDYSPRKRNFSLGRNDEVAEFDVSLYTSGGELVQWDSETHSIAKCHILELQSPKKHPLWSLSRTGEPNYFPSLLTARIVLKTYSNSSCPSNTSEGATCIEAVKSDVYEVKFGPNMAHELKYSDRLLKGFGMHHEQLFSGRTMSSAAIMKDIYLLKQVGANVIRTSHYPYSSEYLDACDENGILVIAECQAVGLKSFSDIKLMLHKQLLLEMMQRDHHHPSIIMWSIANEPQSQLNESRAYFKSLLDYARNQLAKFTVDADRSLTAAIAQSHQDDKIGDLLDVIMVNRYYGWYDYTGVLKAIRPALTSSLLGWSEKYPHKPLILSEFGADTIAGLHQNTGEIFSEEYQENLLTEYEKTLHEICRNATSRIPLRGSMIWNFADFSTHESLLRVGGNRKGIFTQSRQPKSAVKTVQDYYIEQAGRRCPNRF